MFKLRLSTNMPNKNKLEGLARQHLDPKQLQIMVVADKTTSVKKGNGQEVTLEEDLKELAEELKLPYKELELR